MSKAIEEIASGIEKALESLFSNAKISSKNHDEMNFIYLLFGCILSKGICSPSAYSHNETFALYERMLDLVNILMVDPTTKEVIGASQELGN